MKRSGFVFDSIDLLYYKLHKISLNRGGSCIDSPEWLKNKKIAINPINKKDDKCFQYAITASLNHQNIKNNPERISKNKPFIDQYNWKKIEFPSHTQKNWNEFEKNHKTIALNVLFVPYNTEQIRPACVSKYNSKRENQVILLMITDDKKWHYLAVKSLPALFREITSNHHADFYCSNCFHSFTTKNVFKKHDVCKDHDHCYVEMPNKDNNILKYNHGENFMKALFIIYADLESLLEKSSICHNNPNESSTIKINNHTPGYLLFAHCLFDNTKNRVSQRSRLCENAL